MAEVLGGRLLGKARQTASGVSIDTRTIASGEAFVPIVAERDGHQFIDEAIKLGAPIYLTANEGLAVHSSTAAGILVKDTLEALRSLAEHSRQERIFGTVVGITGTAGKTSTKDLTIAALGQKLSVSGSRASENNHLGVMLTLCNAQKANQAVVVEIGASAVGEIRDLAGVAQPSIGVVTSVGSAHIEGFKSLKGVANAKAELVEALEASGTAVLNADNSGSMSLVERTQASVLTYGTRESAAVRAENISLDKNLAGSFTAATPWGRARVSLKACGAVNISNALAAIAVAGTLGVSPRHAAKGLKKAQLSALRMQITRRKDGLTVINDTYNANPTSIRAALLDLKSLPAESHIAILGTMKEMGTLHGKAHREMTELAAELGVRLVAYCEPAYCEGPAGREVQLVQNEAEAQEAIANLGKGDALLIKASRSVGLEELAEKALNS